MKSSTERIKSLKEIREGIERLILIERLKGFETSFYETFIEQLDLKVARLRAESGEEENPF